MEMKTIAISPMGPRGFMLAASFVLMIWGCAGMSETMAVFSAADNVEVDGIFLLRDASTKGDYYYLPPRPVVASDIEGERQVSIIVSAGQHGSPGTVIVHATMQMGLDQDKLADLESDLRSSRPDSRIRGVVPIRFSQPRALSALLEYDPNSWFVASVPEVIDGIYRFEIAAAVTGNIAMAFRESLRSKASDLSVEATGTYSVNINGRPTMHTFVATGNVTIYDE